MLVSKFATLTHDSKVYEEFIGWKGEEYDQYLANSKKERNSVESLIRERDKDLADYIRKNMSIKKDKQEEQIYETEKSRLNGIVAALKEQRDNLEVSDRNHMYELEAFVEILKDA